MRERHALLAHFQCQTKHQSATDTATDAKVLFLPCLYMSLSFLSCWRLERNSNSIGAFFANI